MVQPSSSSLIITSMMMISINTNLRWVDVISRAGHRTGEHEGGDSLQLPGLELSVKIIIIVLRRSTIIDFCHHDNDKGFVNKNEQENHYQFDHHHLYRRGIIIMNMIWWKLAIMTMIHPTINLTTIISAGGEVTPFQEEPRGAGKPHLVSNVFVSWKEKQHKTSVPKLHWFFSPWLQNTVWFHWLLFVNLYLSTCIFVFV